MWGTVFYYLRKVKEKNESDRVLRGRVVRKTWVVYLQSNRNQKILTNSAKEMTAITVYVTHEDIELRNSTLNAVYSSSFFFGHPDDTNSNVTYRKRKSPSHEAWYFCRQFCSLYHFPNKATASLGGNRTGTISKVESSSSRSVQQHSYFLYLC